MELEGFEGAVRRTAERYGMDLSRPLAMVSGGPDSVALLRVLIRLGSEPVVLHVDHGLRGAEAREDASFVQRLCHKLGVRCEVRRVRLEGATNLQERARGERYRLAEEAADRLEASSIALGHNAGDVAETVLMNLARGGALRALAGIPPVRKRLVRPLIERTREEILAYLSAHGQPYRTDPTNLQPKYARNRIRLEVLPVLEELYPGAVRSLARAASLAREDLEVLEALAAEVVDRGPGEVVIPLHMLGEMRAALRRYAVRAAYGEAAPGAPPLESALVEAVLALGRRGDGTRTLDLPGGIVAAARSGEELAFYPREGEGPDEVPLRPGRGSFAGWSIDAQEVAEFDAGDARRDEVVYLDAGRGPFRVRLAREGDTIRPLGLGGTKKVLRAMMDRKVPKDLRRRTPVVVDSEGRVAWVFCGEVGEEFRVTGRTRRILRVEVEKS